MKILVAALAAAILSTGGAFAGCSEMTTSPPGDQTVEGDPIVLPEQVGS